MPISAAKRRKTSEGRRARGASLADEKRRMRYRGVSRFGRGVGSSTGLAQGLRRPRPTSDPVHVQHVYATAAEPVPAAVRPNSNASASRAGSAKSQAFRCRMILFVSDLGAHSTLPL